MSTIISHNMAMGLPSIKMYAPECRTVINGTDITGHLIEVHGNAKSPFILGVRFIDCTIIAENLLAFDSCYFDDTCTMKVKNMPLCGYASINNNCIIKAKKKIKIKISKSVIDDVKRAEREQSLQLSNQLEF